MRHHPLEGPASKLGGGARFSGPFGGRSSQSGRGRSRTLEHRVRKNELPKFHRHNPSFTNEFANVRRGAGAWLLRGYRITVGDVFLHESRLTSP
jgi:hypothetical protein